MHLLTSILRFSYDPIVEISENRVRKGEHWVV